MITDELLIVIILVLLGISIGVCLVKFCELCPCLVRHDLDDVYPYYGSVN